MRQLRDALEIALKPALDTKSRSDSTHTRPGNTNRRGLRLREHAWNRPAAGSRHPVFLLVAIFVVTIAVAIMVRWSKRHAAKHFTGMKDSFEGAREVFFGAGKPLPGTDESALNVKDPNTALSTARPLMKCDKSRLVRVEFEIS